jgi:fructose-1,6-bisphosphatase I
MLDKPLSLTEFLLEEERKYPTSTGSYTHLLTQIAFAGKIIASHIKQAGLVDILGMTGERNTYQEEVVKIDRFSNDLLLDTLSASGQVARIASEEMADFYTPQETTGEYVVFLDPLDGSSNTDIDVTVGTIFSIYHSMDCQPLPKGKDMIASGYILYGTSVMFVYSCGNGVNGFTLDPSVGDFLLSHPDIVVPEKGNIYSVNEASYPQWDKKLQEFIKHVKTDTASTARYVGSMVADVHRTLLKGGIFLYPTDTSYPDGKLRLLFEVNPMSYLVTQAKGAALCGEKDPLSILPKTLHQRVPIALGSRENIDKYKQIVL